MTTILSLGAGVQSTTLLLMCLRDEWPRPDHVVFADTGWEPKGTYDHLEWLKSQTARAGLTIDIVSAGNIRADLLAAKQGARFASLPFHALLKGETVILRRQCTTEYKAHVLDKYAKQYAGDDEVESWIGISLDEARRMRAARRHYVRNRWPLIELNMGRGDCIQWLRRHGYVIPPKSSCLCCPYHSNAVWSELSKTEEWPDVVAFDRVIRRMPLIKGDCYLHRSCKPLDKVDFRTDLDCGQLLFYECMGICGT